MEDMKSDMTGAAVVLAAMSAVARLGVEANVIGYLAITENMINGKAMRLGDVLTMRNGKTVEVLNTDAEGRIDPRRRPELRGRTEALRDRGPGDPDRGLYRGLGDKDGRPVLE